jgi:MarR family transcriptional regulator, temperature-dependent positive regulator of motility
MIKKLGNTIDDFELLDHAGHLLRRAQQIAVAAYAAEVGRDLRPRQFSLLLAIYQQPGLHQVELTELIAMDRSTISEISDRLEKRDLLERRVDEKDERASKLFLTVQGKLTVEEALPKITEVHQNLLARLPEPLHEPFLKALKILSNSED